jgi:hypothetical protein
MKRNIDLQKPLMPIFLLVIILMQFNIAYSQNQCFILFRINDCSNCSNAFFSIDKISKELNTKIYIESKYKKFDKQIRKKKIPKVAHKYEIIYSDSIFDKYAKRFSSQIIIVNSKGEKIYNSNFAALKMILPQINYYSIKHTEDVLLLNDEISISDDPQINYQNDKFFVLDQSFGFLYIFDAIEGNKYKYLDFGDSLYRTIFNTFFMLDSVEQNVFEKMLLVNQVTIFPETFWFKDDSLCITLSIKAPFEYSDGKHMMRNEIVMYNTKAKRNKFKLVVDPDDYVIDPFMEMQFINGNLYASVFGEYDSLPYYHIAKYLAKDSFYYQDSLYELELPKFFLKSDDPWNFNYK